MEQGLLWLDVKVICTEACENPSDMVSVKALRFRIHEDVIQVDNHEHVGHVLEDIVHKVLEHGQHIGESHWHNKKFRKLLTLQPPRQSV